MTEKGGSVDLYLLGEVREVRRLYKRIRDLHDRIDEILNSGCLRAGGKRRRAKAVELFSELVECRQRAHRGLEGSRARADIVCRDLLGDVERMRSGSISGYTSLLIERYRAYTTALSWADHGLVMLWRPFLGELPDTVCMSDTYHWRKATESLRVSGRKQKGRE